MDEPDEAVCPACGQAISYCPGHGESGDPVGHAILKAHDNDDHGLCHDQSDCR